MTKNNTSIITNNLASYLFFLHQTAAISSASPHSVAPRSSSWRVGAWTTAADWWKWGQRAAQWRRTYTTTATPLSQLPITARLSVSSNRTSHLLTDIDTKHDDRKDNKTRFSCSRFMAADTSQSPSKHKRALSFPNLPWHILCLPCALDIPGLNYMAKSCRTDYHYPSRVLEIQHSPNRQHVHLTAKAGDRNERPVCHACVNLHMTL